MSYTTREVRLLGKYVLMIFFVPLFLSTYSVNSESWQFILG